MSIELPESVAGYFTAENTDDTEALLGCFTDHAVVRDEGRTIEGLAAIEQWMVEAKRKYQHTAQPIEAFERDGKTVVVAKVSGNFSNSPVNLEHIFGLASGRIASLEIR